MHCIWKTWHFRWVHEACLANLAVQNRSEGLSNTLYSQGRLISYSSCTQVKKPALILSMHFYISNKSQV
jgi:hypothetical protein